MSRACLLAWCLSAAVVSAAEWHTGQAARAVLGQQSFSAHEGALNPTALSVAGSSLFVADASGHVLTYSLQSAWQGQGPCAVCGGTPVRVATQLVPALSARFAASGPAVAVADTDNHRVLLWLDKANTDPDVILQKESGVLAPVSVALDEHFLYVGDAFLQRVLVWEISAAAAGRSPSAILGDSGAAGANTIGVPTAIASNGESVFVADASNHRILVFSPSSLSLPGDAVVNSASLIADTFAPGTLVTIRGDDLASIAETAPDDGLQPFPSTLGGTTVYVDGRPIPLLSVRADEIRAQLPYKLTYATSASLYVQTGNATSNPVALHLGAASPGIFAFAGHEPRGGLLLHNGRPVTVNDPATAGEELVIWAAGLGLTSAADDAQPTAGVPYTGEPMLVRNPVEVEISGSDLPVVSALLPTGAAGIYEVRVLLPPDLPAGPNNSLRLRQGSSVSNQVTFPLGSTIHN